MAITVLLNMFVCVTQRNQSVLHLEQLSSLSFSGNVGDQRGCKCIRGCHAGHTDPVFTARGNIFSSPVQQYRARLFKASLA